MAVHIKWTYPKIEDDYTIHVQLNGGVSLCGLSYEGVKERTEQDFVTTKKKISCHQCLQLIDFCKNIKDSECYKKPTK